MNTNPVVEFLSNSILAITGKKKPTLTVHTASKSEVAETPFIDCNELLRKKPMQSALVATNNGNDNYRAYNHKPYAEKKPNRVPGLYGCNRWKSTRDKVASEQEIFEFF